MTGTLSNQPEQYGVARSFPDEGDSIRTLYAWGVGATAGLVALVWWFTPAQQTLQQPETSPSPQPKKVLISAVAPPSGLPPGTTVMASFPDVNITVEGNLLPETPAGTVQAEFEVACAESPGRVEVWTRSPQGGTTCWTTTAVEANRAELGPPQPSPPAGTPREWASYRYPNPGAKAARKVENQWRPPKGVTVPATVKPMSPEQLQAMAERYRAKP